MYYTFKKSWKEVKQSLKKNGYWLREEGDWIKPIFAYRKEGGKKIVVPINQRFHARLAKKFKSARQPVTQIEIHRDIDTNLRLFHKTRFSDEKIRKEIKKLGEQ